MPKRYLQEPINGPILLPVVWAFFGISDPSEKILKIALLFRNGSGSRVQRNADGSDMYIPVYEAGLNVRITDPISEPKFKPTPELITKSVGDAINITAKASSASDIKLFLNQVQVGTTATGVTSYSTTATITTAGQQLIVAEAKAGADTKYDSIKFFVYPTVTTAALPAGVRDGINYDANNTSLTLVLYAPNKTRVSVIGDFNDWSETLSHQLNRTPDGLRYWITINGLTPGTEYGYQYVIDGTLKVADYMTEKVLDPSKDQYIPVARPIYNITIANEYLRESTAEKVGGRGLSGADATEIQKTRSEVRFLRAFNYWIMLDLFGKSTFITEENKIGTDLPSEIQRTALFDYIEKELLAIWHEQS